MLDHLPNICGVISLKYLPQTTFCPVSVFVNVAIANAKDGPTLELTLKDLYLALAKVVPADPNGDTVKPNPYKMWNEINPNLPATPIVVIGPPPTSGTRDAFNELAIEGGCKTFPKLKAIKKQDKKKYKAICRAVREDGGLSLIHI